MNCVLCGVQTSMTVMLFKKQQSMCYKCQLWFKQNPYEAMSVLKNVLEKINGKMANS